jgi:hypothetical protein
MNCLPTVIHFTSLKTTLTEPGDRGMKVKDTRNYNKNQIPWPLVRERTIPTEGPPNVYEI